MFVIASRKIVELNPKIAGDNRLAFGLHFYCSKGHTTNSLRSPVMRFDSEIEALRYRIDNLNDSWIVLEIVEFE